jgi:hypothetical protein
MVMTFKYTEPRFKIKTIKAGDGDWYMKDGLIVTPRAGFEINERCPVEYRDIINQCLLSGWLKPIAYMRESEYMWEKLSE